MDRNFLFIFIFGIVFGILFSVFYSSFISPVSVESVFSPGEGEKVISFIDSAQNSLDIEMYVFTSRDVLDALKRAHDRGVVVRIILEKRVLSKENEKIFDELQAYGIRVAWASQEYKLTHAKFIIADNARVFVGSHNFSNSALNENREASVIIISQKIIQEFKEIFEQDWIKSTQL